MQSRHSELEGVSQARKKGSKREPGAGLDPAQERMPRCPRRGILSESHAIPRSGDRGLRQCRTM